MAQGVVDGLEVLGDGAEDAPEGLEAAAPRPAQPVVEAGDAVVAPGAEHPAQPILGQVAAVERARWVCSTRASAARGAPVGFAASFSSTSRSPFTAAAADSVSLALRHVAPRSSSTASLPHVTTRNGSRHGRALGQSRATDSRHALAASRRTRSIGAHASGPNAGTTRRAPGRHGRDARTAS